MAKLLREHLLKKDQRKSEQPLAINFITATKKTFHDEIFKCSYIVSIYLAFMYIYKEK